MDEGDLDSEDQSELNDYSDEVENEITPVKSKSSAKLSHEPLSEPASPSKYELDADNYDIDDVVDKMCGRKDRKIPGTVYKPHSDKILII
jgi:hypothetical protein